MKLNLTGKENEERFNNIFCDVMANCNRAWLEYNMNDESDAYYVQHPMSPDILNQAVIMFIQNVMKVCHFEYRDAMKFDFSDDIYVDEDYKTKRFTYCLLNYYVTQTIKGFPEIKTFYREDYLRTPKNITEIQKYIVNLPTEVKLTEYVYMPDYIYETLDTINNMRKIIYEKGTAHFTINNVGSYNPIMSLLDNWYNAKNKAEKDFVNREDRFLHEHKEYVDKLTVKKVFKEMEEYIYMLANVVDVAIHKYESLELSYFLNTDIVNKWDIGVFKEHICQGYKWIM